MSERMNEWINWVLKTLNPYSWQEMRSELWIKMLSVEILLINGEQVMHIISQNQNLY